MAKKGDNAKTRAKQWFVEKFAIHATLSHTSTPGHQ
jgi:hypothetical protein